MIILASGSPRRAKLLKDAGVDFRVITSDVEEIFDPNLKPDEIVMHLAKLKTRHVSIKYPNDAVLGADTMVVLDDEILGKPTDENDAFDMLKKLSNRCHTVYTGVSIMKGNQEETFYCQTEVCIKPLSDLEIKAYIKTKEPMDKAGAYGIQGEGSKLVERYQGDFFTVMGLPLKEVIKKLKNFE